MVFHFIFPGMVISYDQKYGPIGIIFVLMSFFIAIGVVIILGAAVGLMWQDRWVATADQPGRVAPIRPGGAVAMGAGAGPSRSLPEPLIWQILDG